MARVGTERNGAGMGLQFCPHADHYSKHHWRIFEQSQLLSGHREVHGEVSFRDNSANLNNRKTT